MVHSTSICTAQRGATCSSTSFVNSPVVKAAYSSCIGVDVHHSILVCAYQRCDPQQSQIHTEIREFGTGAGAIRDFAQWCRSCDPERIVMESTGILRVSPYQALESVGFTRQQLALINARDFKAVSGRKTDKKNAQNLAEYGRIGMVRASFVPERRFREMRMVARQYSKTVSELARNKSRYMKFFNFVGCRIANAFSDVNGKAAQAILKAHLAHEGALIELVKKIRWTAAS